MRIQLALPVLATCLAAAVMPGAALAQETTDGLAGADVDTLRSEIGQRYDAALAATLDPAGISKCQTAYAMMTRQPALAAAPPPPPPPPHACPGDLPGMIFFDWDSDVPPVDAGQTAAFVARNAGPCGWSSFGATGHADRSGSDAYNVELSRRRAEAVASLLASAGIPRASITTDARGEEQPRVPTADGVREPQNRRVEITVR